MALRACPIDELGLGLDTEKVIEDTGEYSDIKFPAYSRRYRAFFSRWLPRNLREHIQKAFWHLWSLMENMRT